MRLLLLLIVSSSLAIAQQDQPMPGMNMQRGSVHMNAPDANQYSGPITPAIDLLAETHDRAALPLEVFEHLITTANPTLLQAEATARRSAAQATQAGLYPNPAIGYQGDQIRGGSYAGGEQGGYIQQTIVLGNKLSLNRETLRQQQAADTISIAVTRIRIHAQLHQLFASALAAQAEVDLNKHLLDLSNETLETARRLANIGQADQPDILQAEVESGEATIDFTAAQREYIARFRALAALSGQPNMPLARLSGDFTAPPVIDTEAIVATILRENPAVLGAQQSVEHANAALKAAGHASIPDLDLRMGLQQNNEHLDGTGKATGLQGFASAGIAVPIFNRNQGNIAAARADIEIAQQERLRIERTIRASAVSMIEQHQISRDEAALYRTQLLPRAQQAYDLYRDRYQQMAGAYSSVLVSQRTLFELQSKYIAALLRTWQTGIALEDFTLDNTN